MGTLATAIRDRLGAPPDLERWPIVSIVVINRDGAAHLRRLLAGLVERTDYPNLELILVDNGSSDASLDFIRTVEAPFPIAVVANHHNESFSDANNQGAELGGGELLLFLNNDIEPFEPGWLRELVACHRDSGAGAVGAALIYPDDENGVTGRYLVQSNPIRLRERDGLIGAEGWESHPELFGDGFGEDRESIVLIAACLLIEPARFWEVGGFTHGFFYGGEDDDLALKLRTTGAATLYSGRSFVIHHISSTSRHLLGGAGGAIRQGNRRLLLSRWGPRAWRELALDRLAGGNLWAAPGCESLAMSREEVLALGFCLRARDPAAEPEAPRLRALEAELARRRHRCIVLPAGSADGRGYLYDVVVHLRGAARHVPAPGQLNVLWALSDLDSLSAIECARYDLVVTSEVELAARLRGEGCSTPVRALDGEEPAGELVEAVLRRAEEIRLPRRIEAEPGAPG